MMFSILVLGFNCLIYKKEPKVRMYFDTLFVDEVNIKLSNNFEETPNLYFYQLRIPTNLTKSYVKLIVDNDDSNHNNSFMTKSTLLKLHTFYLIPAKDCEDAYKVLQTQNTSAFNLLPYTAWQSDLGVFQQDIQHYTIGGSGVFKCNLKKYFNNYFKAIY